MKILQLSGKVERENDNLHTGKYVYLVLFEKRKRGAFYNGLSVTALKLNYILILIVKDLP